MSVKRQKPLFSKLEKASLTAWSLTYSGKNSVTKIGSFPFPRGPDSCFWKLKLSPCVQNTYGSFWFKNQNELQGRNFIQIAYFCDNQFLEYKKIFHSRNFFGSTSEHFPFIWAAFSSPRALCHTSLVFYSPLGIHVFNKLLIP